tara:strand:- start:1847 stop:2710 length:864 start_codon:yes stop_codon:yes gene_type:complete
MANDREADLRYDHIDRAVKAATTLSYELKTLCTVDSSSAWTETYFRETNDDSTDGGTGSPIKGVPQYAPFPFFDVTETKVQSVIQKYAGESIISLEAEQNATLPMLQRKIFRLSRKIAYQVDSAIESEISDNAGNTNAIAAGSEWDSATIANRDPVKDFLDAIQLLRADGYDALKGKGYIVMNGTDYTNVISNSKVLNHPTYQSVSAVENGQVARLVGLTIMVSETVTADQAYVLISKEALTWKQASALTVKTIEDPGKSTTIRAWERGVPQMVVPNAACKITNTRA